MASHDHKNLTTRIIDLEESTWRALQKSGEGMIPFITDDCTMQFPLGMKVTSKSEPSVIDILKSPAFIPWKSFEMSKIDVQPVGDVAAIITYLARATRPAVDETDVDMGFEALCSSVWRWDGKKYSLCFHQQTLTT